MNAPDLTCKDEQRRHDVRAATLNGLDYLEVSDDQRALTVYFLGKAPDGIVKENVRIDGGRRIRNIRVIDLRVDRQDDPEVDDCMTLVVDRAGDFSTYRLCLVEVDERGRPTDQPLSGFDPRYACLEFSFKAGCPSDLDCKAETICPPEPHAEPEINYLAKDYASFRQLLLDRLALIMPDWQEHHVPDLGIALVELLAYVGDYLSYYQDAIATEAYLDTARQRISVHRHVRLVDYPMHEGCNARAWVFVETKGAHQLLHPQEFYFITRHDDSPADGRPLTVNDLVSLASNRYEVFEPLVESFEEPIKFVEAHNEIPFYTWGDRQCCIPRGATQATLQDTWVPPPPEPMPYQQTARQYGPSKTPETPPTDSPKPERKLSLKPGDFLLIEEVVGPTTGNPADADPTHRHVVRLTQVKLDEDPLFTQKIQRVNQELPTPIIEIEWAGEDALPFPLCLSAIGPAPECKYLDGISVARGNIILVDHGQTMLNESLGMVPIEDETGHCEGEGQLSEIVPESGQFRPQLQKVPLTFSQPLPINAPAAHLLIQDVRWALPTITSTSTAMALQGLTVEEQWTVQRDLLSSHGSDHHFVAEIDNDGRVHLRFGDGELGRRPEAGMAFTATYRVGNGASGNVGAEAIAHLVLRQATLSGVTLRPRNPLPAQGGIPPEPLAEVKLFAPHAFRKELQRAVTAEDYAELVRRAFKDKVQRARASLRWTGSWYEALVAIDALGQEEADAGLLHKIKGDLYHYRRIGHDLVVKPAHYVSLDIAMTICVLPHYLRGHVKAALLKVFSNRILPDGQRGFFHADQLSFGEGIYLSKLVASAQAVPGVESVTVTRLERLFEGPNQEIESGILPLGSLEIARLDNDPNFPEHGKLVLDVRGGR
jgi:hypothetical protein